MCSQLNRPISSFPLPFNITLPSTALLRSGSSSDLMCPLPQRLRSALLLDPPPTALPCSARLLAPLRSAPLLAPLRSGPLSAFGTSFRYQLHSAPIFAPLRRDVVHFARLSFNCGSVSLQYLLSSAPISTRYGGRINFTWLSPRGKCCDGVVGGHRSGWARRMWRWTSQVRRRSAGGRWLLCGQHRVVDFGRNRL